MSGQKTDQPTGEAVEGTAPETQAPSPLKSFPEIKIVIVIKDDHVLMGVSSPDCDPVYKTMTGTLSAALKKVSALVTEAKLHWETNPQYPKAVLPEPPPSPTPARTPPAVRPAPRPPAQPSFF